MATETKISAADSPAMANQLVEQALSPQEGEAQEKPPVASPSDEIGRAHV